MRSPLAGRGGLGTPSCPRWSASCALAILLTMGMSACKPTDDSPPAPPLCPAVLYASMIVDVVSGSGAPICDATVTAVGAGKELGAIHFGDCTSRIPGGKTGSYRITARKAGYEEASTQVEVRPGPRPCEFTAPPVTLVLKRLPGSP